MPSTCCCWGGGAGGWGGMSSTKEAGTTSGSVNDSMAAFLRASALQLAYLFRVGGSLIEWVYFFKTLKKIFRLDFPNFLNAQ